jgi:hypothetical protein
VVTREASVVAAWALWAKGVTTLVATPTIGQKTSRLVESGRRQTTRVIHGANGRNPIVRYACLIYYNPKTLFGGSPEANAVLAECSTYDDKLKESGHFVVGEALELPESAMTVKVRDGKMSAVDGPFMETKEMLGGIILIEAHDLNEAARVASGHPLARLGAVEVRPVVDFSQPRPEL